MKTKSIVNSKAWTTVRDILAERLRRYDDLSQTKANLIGDQNNGLL